MDIDLLRAFLTAARLGSLRRAADELFLSPPAVTLQIRRLERELGCRLLERGSRGVRLSPAGWWLMPRAQAALSELDAAREGLLAFGEGAERRVALAASPFLARTALPYALAQLRSERPELDYAVDVLQSTEIAAAVAQGRADLGLSLLPGADTVGRPAGRRRRVRPSGGVTAERLWTEPVVLVVPVEGMGGEGGLPDWRTVVRGHRLLTGSQPAFWEELLASLRRQGVLGRTMPVSDMDITRRFIAEGLGVSFLPVSVVGDELRTGRMVAVPTDGLEVPAAEVFAVRRVARGSRGAGPGGDGDGADALVATLKRLRGGAQD